MTPDDLLTVTLNPTIDLSSSVAEVRPGPKLRCAPPLVEPGGGGLNVARAIALLGGTARALVAVGGATGDRLLSLLTEVGVPSVAMTAPGETRQSLAVTDRTTGGQYRFVLPGPAWGPADVETALAAIATAAREGGIVVLSGSQPPGVPEDFPLRLARRLQGRARLIVDTSGGPLRALAEGGHDAAPWILRMDSDEAEELAGQALPTAADSARLAAGMVAQGVAGVVILARGAEGAVLAAPGLRLFAPNAPVEVVSRIGAGDSFVGALALSLARGEGLAAALSHGNAAASAAVITEGTRLCRREDVVRLLPECAAREV
ncbi:1-phosphofructokinase family hexose kinase [Acidimangrovimonas sediminis]|uniref:1-phosphofructokinase family hexose kinase n=1 Tax=Acidimangrovimonas sediminis TaxID=2056283 RepID=UPI000C805735|nr:1-phosphofructokinase family hexose kinase [Acidimangrovimonas sediminis]